MKIVKKNSTENCHFHSRENRCIVHGRIFVINTAVLTVKATTFCVLANIRYFKPLASSVAEQSVLCRTWSHERFLCNKQISSNFCTEMYPQFKELIENDTYKIAMR